MRRVPQRSKDQRHRVNDRTEGAATELRAWREQRPLISCDEISSGKHAVRARRNLGEREFHTPARQTETEPRRVVQKRQKLESICPVMTVIMFVHILQMPQTSIRGGIPAQRIRSCTNTEKHHGYSGKCVVLGLRNRDNLMKMTIRQKSPNVVGTQQ